MTKVGKNFLIEMTTILLVAAAAVLAYFFGKLKRKKVVLPVWEEKIRLAFEEFRKRQGGIVWEGHKDFGILEENILKEVQKEVDRIREKSS